MDEGANLASDRTQVSLCAHPPLMHKPERCACGYPKFGPGSYTRRREWRDGRLVCDVRGFLAW
jgi:hypothetical protein